MATTKTFPGVYTSITDQSFIQPVTSRFKPAILGAATKGPFNVPTAVRSLKEFRRIFGKPLTTTYDQSGNPVGPGFFLADTVAILTSMTDAITVIRVGNQYADAGVISGAASSGAYTFNVTHAQAAQLAPTADTDVFVRLKEEGKATTLNVQVTQAGVDSVGNGTVVIDNTGDALAANYLNAAISYSNFSGAANSAESILTGYTYDTTSAGSLDASLTQFGTIAGQKNDFFFTVQANGTGITPGKLFKIRQPGTGDDTRTATHEVRVKSVVGNTVYLETSNNTRIGYQALPLQDSYDNAYLYEATGTKAFLRLEAATPGEWANGTTNRTGLYVQVRPGSSPGTKKFEIFLDGALVEVLDNLSDTDDQTDENSYTRRINGISQYITITSVFDTGSGQRYHAANTASPWDATYAAPSTVLSPRQMPFGAINTGGSTGGQFIDGANGENVQESDYVGTVNPDDDTGSGLKALEDADNVDVNVIAVPVNLDGFSGLTPGMAVMQEAARVARKINAIAITDIPPGLNARVATDWHNGAGVYTGRGRIDNPNIAVFWNWFTLTDPFTGLIKLVPPSLGALRAMAFTWDRDKPWYAAAGETRGVIVEALSAQFDKVAEDVKQAMYGNGNSVNPILKVRGRWVLYGERTLQRAESKLTAIHSVVLVNFIVTGLADLGRRYVFDPNDNELLVHIRLAFTEFLDKVRNERGLEDYNLVVDDRNNTADTRNRREVIVDLAVIPTDVAERIFINATVKESGAQLNSAIG